MPKPTFKELAEALDKALHHSYSYGRLVDMGQDKAAKEEQQKADAASLGKIVLVT